MLQEVVDFFDNQFSMKDATVIYRDQWQTLKAAVLAQQATNKASTTHCDNNCGSIAVYHLCKKCMREDAAFYARQTMNTAESEQTAHNKQIVQCKVYASCKNTDKGCFCEGSPMCFKG